MRPLIALALTCAAAMLSGCIGTLNDAQTFLVAKRWTKIRPAVPPLSPEDVVIQYIRVEREVGNKEIAEDLWYSGNDQFLTPTRKTEMSRNGLRVARLGDQLDPVMQGLLRDDGQQNEGQNFQTNAGAKVKIEMTSLIPEWNFFHMRGEGTVGEKLTASQGYFVVTPTLASRTRVRLSLLPVFEYGEPKRYSVPSTNLGGLELRVERESKMLTDLGFEVELASGEFIVIGCENNREGSIGHTLMTREKNGKKTQSVLLIRAIRPSKEDLFQSGFDVNDFFLTPEQATARRSPVRETVQLSQPGQLIRVTK